jgi:hypothetical protein
MTADLRAQRSAHYRAAADRPSQRRNAPEGTSFAVRASMRDFELRETGGDSGALTFVGYASVTETGYEMYDMFGPYTEVVAADAFDETLNRADLDVPFVIAHDQTRRIARTTNETLNLSVDEHGLRVEATLDPSDVDVAYIVPKLRAGLIDEMSFAFRIEKGRWSPDYTEFRIDKVDIHRGDVAIVGYGANPHTDGGMRTETPAAAPKSRISVPSDLMRARI